MEWMRPDEFYSTAKLWDNESEEDPWSSEREQLVKVIIRKNTIRVELWA